MASPKRLLQFEENPTFSSLLEPEIIKRIAENGLVVKCVENEAGCSWEGPILQLQAHSQSVCDFFFVPCPNGCGEHKVLYKKLNQHRELSCTLEEIPCKYAEDGCTFRCARQDMPTHEKNEPQVHLKFVESSKEKYRTSFMELKKTLDRGVVPTSSSVVNSVAPVSTGVQVKHERSDSPVFAGVAVLASSSVVSDVAVGSAVSASLPQTAIPRTTQCGQQVVTSMENSSATISKSLVSTKKSVPSSTASNIGLPKSNTTKKLPVATSANVQVTYGSPSVPQTPVVPTYSNTVSSNAARPLIIQPGGNVFRRPNEFPVNPFPKKAARGRM